MSKDDKTRLELCILIIPNVQTREICNLTQGNGVFPLIAPSLQLPGKTSGDTSESEEGSLTNRRNCSKCINHFLSAISLLVVYTSLRMIC